MASIDINQPAPKLLPSQGGDPAEFIPAAEAMKFTGVTLVELVTELGCIERTLAEMPEGTDQRSINTWVRMNELVIAELTERGYVVSPTEAHEQAHCENERRWAAALDLGYSEEADAIRDLAVRVIRYYRLDREPGQPVAFGRYAKLCTMAATELENDFGYEVIGQTGGSWTVKPVV